MSRRTIVKIITLTILASLTLLILQRWIFEASPSHSLRWVKELYEEKNVYGEDFVNASELLVYETNKAYEMGLNKKGIPVFKQPMAAYKQFLIDYSEEIQGLKEEFQLKDISLRSYRAYMSYGWQMPIDGIKNSRKYHDITLFLTIFSESFHRKF